MAFAGPRPIVIIIINRFDPEGTVMKLAPLAIPAIAVLLLAGCAPTATEANTSDDTLAIVASTNVYGDIAATIG